jgi:hypothetical protein
MKEIDFLPEWYRDGKRRESHYRTQYLAIGCLFAVMVACGDGCMEFCVGPHAWQGRSCS